VSAQPGCNGENLGWLAGVQEDLDPGRQHHVVGGVEELVVAQHPVAERKRDLVLGADGHMGRRLRDELPQLGFDRGDGVGAGHEIAVHLDRRQLGTVELCYRRSLQVHSVNYEIERRAVLAQQRFFFLVIGLDRLVALDPAAIDDVDDFDVVIPPFNCRRGARFGLPGWARLGSKLVEESHRSLPGLVQAGARQLGVAGPGGVQLAFEQYDPVDLEGERRQPIRFDRGGPGFGVADRTQAGQGEVGCEGSSIGREAGSIEQIFESGLEPFGSFDLAGEAGPEDPRPSQVGEGFEARQLEAQPGGSGGGFLHRRGDRFPAPLRHLAQELQGQVDVVRAGPARFGRQPLQLGAAVRQRGFDRRRDFDGDEGAHRASLAAFLFPPGFEANESGRIFPGSRLKYLRRQEPSTSRERQPATGAPC
jgi:hypothetical protein